MADDFLALVRAARAISQRNPDPTIDSVLEALLCDDEASGARELFAWATMELVIWTRGGRESDVDQVLSRVLATQPSESMLLALSPIAVELRGKSPSADAWLEGRPELVSGELERRAGAQAEIDEHERLEASMRRTVESDLAAMLDQMGIAFRSATVRRKGRRGGWRFRVELTDGRVLEGRPPEPSSGFRCVNCMGSQIAHHVAELLGVEG